MPGERWAVAGRIVLGLWMVAVTAAAFLWVPPDWTQVAGQRVGLGEGVRIIFFHIPTAWVTVLAFLISSLYGILYLLRRQRMDDHRAVNAAGLGMVFCLLATLSGSLFARITWGSFWNWDPRETTIFFLLLFYAAYFALRMAVGDEERRATLSAAYNILGLVVVPFLVFVAPRLAALAGLHPDLFGSARGGLPMGPRTLSVFLAALAGFTGIFLWLFSLANRVSRIAEAFLEEDGAWAA